MENQKNNLDTFKTLHMVHGILALATSILPLIYVGLGTWFTLGEFPGANEAPPAEFGVLMIIFGLVFFLLILTFGILQLYAAKFIGQRKNYNFVFVMAVVTCLTGMLGLILGIFSIIELNKPHVKELFD